MAKKTAKNKMIAVTGEQYEALVALSETSVGKVPVSKVAQSMIDLGLKASGGGGKKKAKASKPKSKPVVVEEGGE